MDSLPIAVPCPGFDEHFARSSAAMRRRGRERGESRVFRASGTHAARTENRVHAWQSLQRRAFEGTGLQGIPLISRALAPHAGSVFH
jgi:hypothetical protein